MTDIRENLARQERTHKQFRHELAQLKWRYLGATDGGIGALSPDRKLVISSRGLNPQESETELLTAIRRYERARCDSSF